MIELFYKYKDIDNNLIFELKYNKNLIYNSLEIKPGENIISQTNINNFLFALLNEDDLKLYYNNDKFVILEKEKYKYSIKHKELEQLNFKPFPHQVDAFNYHVKHKQWLLLDSMGLGKTLEIIGAAELLYKRGLIEHCLIICGVNSIKENWLNEIKKYSSLSGTILGRKVSKNGKVSYRSVKECVEILKHPIEEFFVITNIEKLRGGGKKGKDKEKDLTAALLKGKNDFGMIVVDEIHRTNNKKSQQGAHLLKLSSEYMVGVTGTLITNNPISAYLPLVFTKNDNSILTTYRPQYEVKDADDRVVGYQNLDVLREEVESCSLRRTLPQIRSDMPGKFIEYEYIEMEPDHKKFYDEIVDGIGTQVDLINLDTSNLLALTTRLRQASVDPSILSSNDIKSSKILRCLDLVEEILSQGEKVVIMSNFVQPIKTLSEALKEYKPLLILGELSAGERQRNNNLFQENDDYKIIMGTHQAMGTGLTFNSSMYLIMLDTPWTYSSFDQSCDRIYRVNNTRPAFIKVLENVGTIDTKIHEVLDEKKEYEDYIVDGKEKTVDKVQLESQRELFLRLLSEN